MKYLIHAEEVARIKYNDYPVRIIAAIIAAAMIISFGEKEKWYALFSISGYYPALIASTLIALIILEIIYQANRRLDVKVVWLILPYQRLVLQILCCVILPLAVAILLAAIYFFCYNFKLSETNYFERQFIPIVGMVILANVYYIMQFLLRLIVKVAVDRRITNKKLAKQIEQQEQKKLAKIAALKLKKQLIKEANAALVLPKNCHLSNIYLWQSIDRDLWAYYDEEQVPWSNSLQKTMAALPNAHYFQINKSCIVKRNYILKAQHHGNRAIKLYIKSPKNLEVIVAKNHKASFCNWYGKTIYKAEANLHL